MRTIGIIRAKAKISMANLARLQHQDLEHQNRIIRRPAALLDLAMRLRLKIVGMASDQPKSRTALSRYPLPSGAAVSDF